MDSHGYARGQDGKSVAVVPTAGTTPRWVFRCLWRCEVWGDVKAKANDTSHTGFAEGNTCLNRPKLGNALRISKDGKETARMKYTRYIVLLCLACAVLHVSCKPVRPNRHRAIAGAAAVQASRDAHYS